MTKFCNLTGNGDVDSFCFETIFHCLCGKFALCGIQSFFQLRAHGVGCLTHNGSLVCREFAHQFQNGSQFALLTEIFDSQIFQFLLVGCGTHCRKRFQPDLFQLLFH